MHQQKDKPNLSEEQIWKDNIAAMEWWVKLSAYAGPLIILCATQDETDRMQRYALDHWPKRTQKWTFKLWSAP